MKKRIEVWCEGYLATGCEGIPAPATRLAVVEAESLDDACAGLQALGNENSKYYRRHPDGTWSFWGCRIFDNEANARRSFG